MSRVRVKICGVRTLAEAEAAIDAGADALGFNFWAHSPRFIDPSQAAAITRSLPPLVSAIGVFVNEEPDRIIRVVSHARLDAVQLHGDETPEFCAALTGLQVIKAFRVGESFDAREIQAYSVGMALLDTRIKGEYGGTGKRFDWRIAVEAKRYAPVMLAGGLGVENVAEAILAVRPAAIDVCSGVEAEPGKKDFSKIREFMRQVAVANCEVWSTVG